MRKSNKEKRTSIDREREEKGGKTETLHKYTKKKRKELYIYSKEMSPPLSPLQIFS